jgi:hypothetical protein
MAWLDINLIEEIAKATDPEEIARRNDPELEYETYGCGGYDPEKTSDDDWL